MTLSEKFRAVDSVIKENLAGESSSLKQGLAILALANEKFGSEYLTLDEIVEVSDCLDFALDRTSVGRAFSKAGTKIRRKNIGKDTLYKATLQGKREVEDLLNTTGSTVWFLEGGKPRTARKALNLIFSGLSGEVRACDPYYGHKSLDSLERLPKTCKVKFLAGKWSDGTSKASVLADFKREHPNVEIRELLSAGVVHDRYVMSAHELLLVGHGLKDIGNKESFVVRLDDTIAKDVIANLRTVFDQRWALALPV